MSRKTKTLVIIPAFNEEAVIKDVIIDLKNKLNEHNFDYHILVIDDGSTDQTSAQAKSAGAKVINHIINQGCGSATETGLIYASRQGYAQAVTVDADGQHDPNDVVAGLLEMKGSEVDLLIGNRLNAPSSEMSRLKKIGNNGLSFITKLLTGVSIKDSQSGLRIFSETAIRTLRWHSSGFEFCSEMILRAQQLGLTIEEYPIKSIYTDYSKSKGQNNWNAFMIVRRLIKHRVRTIL